MGSISTSEIYKDTSPMLSPVFNLRCRTSRPRTPDCDEAYSLWRRASSEEQLKTLETHIRSLQRSIVEYERIRTDGLRVMTRAHNELEHHFNRYHRHGEIFVANVELRGTLMAPAISYAMPSCTTP